MIHQGIGLKMTSQTCQMIKNFTTVTLDCLLKFAVHKCLTSYNTFIHTCMSGAEAAFGGITMFEGTGCSMPALITVWNHKHNNDGYVSIKV